MLRKSSKWELVFFTISWNSLYPGSLYRGLSVHNVILNSIWEFVLTEMFLLNASQGKIMQHDSMKNDESNCGFELFCKNFSLSAISEIFFTSYSFFKKVI